MKYYRKLLAHYDPNIPGQKQLLVDHLINVAIKSKTLGSSVGLENVCQLIGLLHDFGKLSKEFQLYIIKEFVGNVEHSHGGAIMLEHIAMRVYMDKNVDSYLKSHNLKIRIWKLYNEMLQYPILSHHGLYDIIDKNFNYKTESRLYSDRSLRAKYIEEGMDFLDLLNSEYFHVQGKTIYELYWGGFKEFVKIYKKIQEDLLIKKNLNGEKKLKNKTKHFYYAALVRLLLSILKEADIYDSTNYYRDDDKDKIYPNEELNNICAFVN
ncbi:MAG TPA: CRISPR-associated endonuclease Cas3'' [Thermoclostridium sp.]|nr:CRISPR-associated endonuclease Cas3'' [Thermoclostridium sp.]